MEMARLRDLFKSITKQQGSQTRKLLRCKRKLFKSITKQQGSQTVARR